MNAASFRRPSSQPPSTWEKLYLTIENTKHTRCCGLQEAQLSASRVLGDAGRTVVRGPRQRWRVGKPAAGSSGARYDATAEFDSFTVCWNTE